MDLKLKGKVAVVTGAARGIGRAIALTLAGEGADVVVSDIDIQEAEKVAEEARACGVIALAVRTDVTSSGEVKAMARATFEAFGKIDILVNNAGIVYVGGDPTTRKLFQDFGEDEDYSPELDIILHGSILCTRAVLPHMLRQGSGAIVNIVSEAGVAAGLPGSTIYSAGKGGVVAFSRSLAVELAPVGIRVNCVAPGMTRTTRMERMEKAESVDDKASKTAAYARAAFDEMVARTPLKRLGSPQEIANAAVFLASEASAYTIGQTLLVNGGTFIH